MTNRNEIKLSCNEVFVPIGRGSYVSPTISILIINVSDKNNTQLIQLLYKLLAYNITYMTNMLIYVKYPQLDSKLNIQCEYGCKQSIGTNAMIDTKNSTATGLLLSERTCLAIATKNTRIIMSMISKYQYSGLYPYEHTHTHTHIYIYLQIIIYIYKHMHAETIKKKILYDITIMRIYTIMIVVIHGYDTSNKILYPEQSDIRYLLTVCR